MSVVCGVNSEILLIKPNLVKLIALKQFEKELYLVSCGVKCAIKKLNKNPYGIHN
ncbi:MAG: hypothetical protein ACI857_002832 [Arenicella sp.]|jgi:hypothetical protein